MERENIRMCSHEFMERLEDSATDARGTAVAGWTASLTSLNHSDISNELWTANIGGIEVFVKRFARPDRYLNEVSALGLAKEAGILAPEVVMRIDDLNVLVLSRLDGVLLTSIWPELNRHDRQNTCERAGELSTTLHQECPGALFGTMAAPGSERGTSWFDYVAAVLRKWLSNVSDQKIPVSWFRVENAFSRYVTRESFTSVPGLVHFDISARNIIVTQPRSGEHDATIGLLDFELARYDHPCMDFHNSMGAKWLDYDPDLTRSFRHGITRVASDQEVAEYDHHFDFFMGIVSLSTISYLIKIGNPDSSRQFYDQQVAQLLHSLNALECRR